MKRQQQKVSAQRLHDRCCSSLIKYVSLLSSLGLLASIIIQSSSYSFAFSIKTHNNPHSQHSVMERTKETTTTTTSSLEASSLVGGGSGGMTTTTANGRYESTNSGGGGVSRINQIRRQMNDIVVDMRASATSFDDNDNNNVEETSESSVSSGTGESATAVGRLEELKQREAELSALLAEVRKEKLATLRSRPLTIGIIGYGRFGQFIAKTFTKYGNVIVTSRTDYTDIANSMNAKYVPMNRLDRFLDYDLDVIVIATSIVSFEWTVQMLAPYIETYIQKQKRKFIMNNGPNNNNNNNDAAASLLLRGPLVVDVLSVKEHARQIMIQYLPPQCDILCTHPMFGPDSGKNGWYNLNFVYEKTRIDQVLLSSSSSSTHSTNSKSQSRKKRRYSNGNNNSNETETFMDEYGLYHSVHEGSDAHIEGMDRMERFLSIWEEEGCKMVPMSCVDHDAYAANSQFITHLIGRVLASQGLESTPIDTAGFQSVLRLITNTVSDSFDLFYGLYKYNRKNSFETIQQLQAAMNDVVTKLQEEETNDNKQHETITATSSSSSTLSGNNIP